MIIFLLHEGNFDENEQFNGVDLFIVSILIERLT